jgi:hypothetical protein
MCFFYSDKKANFEQSQDSSTLKTLMGRQYFFLKVTQFSQGNNDLDTPTSNLDSFPWGDICVSSTQLNRPIWKKIGVSLP